MDPIAMLADFIGEMLTAFFNWTTPAFWVGAALSTWLMVAYWLWARIPETPSWSSERVRPTDWWTALTWPVRWPYWLCYFVVFIGYHTLKGFVRWLVMDPIKEWLEYGKLVKERPYVDAFCQDPHCDSTCGLPRAPRMADHKPMPAEYQTN